MTHIKNSLPFHRYLLVLLAFSLGGFSVYSQNSKSDISDNMFVSFVTSTYTDFVQTPVRMVRTVVATEPNPVDPNGPGIPVFDNVPNQSFGLSLFSIGIEPRYNFYQMSDDAALAVAAPISFGLYQVFPADQNLGGSESFGGIQIPVLAKIYLGSGSTYDSEKDFGLSFGFGFEYNKLGLFDFASDVDKEADGGWIMPVTSMGIHFWRGSMPMEINLKYGFGTATRYYVDKNGDPLRDEFGNLTSGLRKAYSFKLSFCYMLNY